MRKSLTLSAAVLGLTSSLALAQAPAPTAPAVAPSTGAATTERPRGSSEFQAARAASVSLAQAIEIAESQAGGGRTISIEFEERDGNEPAHYDVKVVSADGKLVEHAVDAMSGKILKSENQPIERYFTRLKPADIQSAKTSLRDAVSLAERQAGIDARAVEAEVERDGDAVTYEIEVASANGSKEYKVTADGRVTAD
jgi:uncharacterized membrane protein YkoI